MDDNLGDEGQWDELHEEDFLFNPEAAAGAWDAAAAMQLAQEAEGVGDAGAADADAAGGAAAAAAVGEIQLEEEAAAAAGGGAAGEQLPAGGLNQLQQQQGAVADLVAAQLRAVVQAIPGILAQAGIPLHGGQAAQPHLLHLLRPRLPPHPPLLPAGLPGPVGLLLLIQQAQQAQGLPPHVAHFLFNQQQPWLAAMVAADVHQQPLAAADDEVAAPAGAAGVGGWLSRQALQLLLAWAIWSLPFVAAVLKL